MNKTLSFKTSVYAGDLIYTLAGIRQMCEKMECRANIYLWLNRGGEPYKGAQHPYGSSMLNEYALKMLKPLVESQHYINSLSAWAGEDIAVDLDELRTKHLVGMPYGCVTRWPFYIWPDMICDISREWIDISLKPREPHQSTAGKILINRTSRWRNDYINYYFLRNYKTQLIFTGMQEEHEVFCKEIGVDPIEIPLLIVEDFLDLAHAIQSCKFFIGNQSMCFAIAEAMKTARILEVCPFAPNVIVSGKNGYDFLHQFALEYIVKDLNEKI